MFEVKTSKALKIKLAVATETMRRENTDFQRMNGGETGMVLVRKGPPAESDRRGKVQYLAEYQDGGQTFILFAA